MAKLILVRMLCLAAAIVMVSPTLGLGEEITLTTIMPAGGGGGDIVRGKSGVIGNPTGGDWDPMAPDDQTWDDPAYEPTDDCLLVGGSVRISITGFESTGANLEVSGNATVSETLDVTAGVGIGGASAGATGLNVDGDTSINGDLSLTEGGITADWISVGTLGADSMEASVDGDFVVNGDLAVTGSLTVGGEDYKMFVIDHPLYPETKSLRHACLEGPEGGVYYRGEAELVNGEAVVLLPDYFEALTRKEERTVFLTAKGSEPYLLSASEVSGGKFSVYGTKPDGEFYWEVKAVRGDLEPLEVEVLKE